MNAACGVNVVKMSLVQQVSQATQRSIGILALLLVATALHGQEGDPIVGTWKLNVAASKFPRAESPAPKDYVETYRLVGDRIELVTSRTRTRADGTSYTPKYSWPAQGGVVVEHADPTATRVIIETLIAPGEWYVTYMRDGKQTGTRHKLVSKDGKTMRQVLRGLDAQGKPYEQVEVLERH
jgi:hypothetical protein